MTTETLDLITPEQAAEVLLHGGEVSVVEPEQVQQDMVRRILEAGTLQDAFSAFESVPARDIEGQAVEVRGVAWMRSQFKEGPGVYALLDCKLMESKTEAVVSMGGRTTMASFLWAQQNQAMPLRGSFVSSRSNTDPEKMYWTFKLAKQK